jgi:AcrR family transcriptional regulator
MTIYRYFQGRDDLVAALTSHVLRGARADVSVTAPWQTRIRVWMMTVYKQAVLYPRLIELAATGQSPAWVPESLFLSELLRTAGMSDIQRRAEAVFLIGTTSLGQAVVRAAHRELPLPPLHAWIGGLPPDEAAAAGTLVPYLIGLEESTWERMVDLTIAEVARGIDDPASSSRRAK